MSWFESADLYVDLQGQVKDDEGVPIRRLWKTWVYDTILAEWGHSSETVHCNDNCRLMDIVLRDDVIICASDYLLLVLH